MTARADLGREGDDDLSRALSGALFETIGALVVVLDPEGRIVRFNPACERLTGYAAAEVLGRPVLELFVPPDERAGVRSVLGHLSAGDPAPTYENDWLTRGGERRRIAWSNTTLTSPAGEVTWVIGTGVDVTALRKVEEALAAIDAVRIALADEGPTDRALGEITAVLAERFGYTHVAIYLRDGERLRLGAQVGYADPLLVFDRATGIIGQVLRTRRTVFLPDVSTNPNYVALDSAVRSEICAPLLAHGELLGVLNVESTGDRRLDEHDRSVIETIADRLASATALGRERQELAARAELLARLHDFAGVVSSTLEPEVFFDRFVGAVTDVLPVDIVALTVLDQATGRYHVRAVRGIDPDAVGAEIRPGEGVTGRVIRDRALVVDDNPRLAYPTAVRHLTPPDRFLAAGLPLIREGVVVGVLLVGRIDRERPFSRLELDALGLLGSQAALAIANVFLHAEVAESAIRDPLTGLHNRRFFDAALEHLVAARVREPATNRRPLSAIMFDLDHFGRFNREHGHQAGDRVLRTFGAILGRRFRSSDLVGRFGGEEFVAVLEGSELEDAVRVAEEIRVAFREATLVDDEGQPVRCTVSAGCATLDGDEPSAEGLLRAADVALFIAKRLGRDQVVAAPPAVRAQEPAGEATAGSTVGTTVGTTVSEPGQRGPGAAVDEPRQPAW